MARLPPLVTLHCGLLYDTFTKMSINGLGIIPRKASDEANDVKTFRDNIYNESWKSWPNEAAVCVFLQNFGCSRLTH